MPYQGRRQTYRATSSTAIYWFAVGLVVFLLRPAIPPVINAKLAGSASGFVRKAANQQIDWQDMSPDVFQKSRETGKPIFLFIGTEWSEMSMEMDKKVLNSIDVAERLNRDFISVRLDAERSRKWSSCFLQLTRAQVGTETHNQILFLSASGKILRVVTFVPNTRAIDDVSFINILESVKFPSAEDSQLPDEQKQMAEFQALSSGYEQAVPQIPVYTDALLATLSDHHPGFNIGNTQVLPARDYIYLLAAGRSDVVRHQVDSLMSSPAFSWVDGAFFRSARDQDWLQVSFSQSAGRNADMLEVLGSLNGPDDTLVGDEVFDALDQRFVHGDKFYSASYTDLLPDKRSARYSIPSNRAGEVFAADSGRADAIFGLDPTKNPMMVPMAPTWPLPAGRRDEFMEMVARLKAASQAQSTTMSGPSSMDVGARVVTAMVRYATVTGRPDLLARAEADAVAVQTMRLGGGDVRHSTDVATDAYLGDYLNYAELELTLYRVFGDVNALGEGRRTLDRAQFLFAGEHPGVYLNGQFTAYSPECEYWNLPKLVDDDLPATSAQLAYLLRAYASVENDPAARAVMRQHSDDIVSAMAPAANGIARHCATYFLSALLARSDTAVFTVGPECVTQARKFDWIKTLAWSYPALASVRPDLQARGPGYYVETGGKLTGPLTADAVARVLAARPGLTAAP